jgi:hypothetical protein
MSKFDVKQLSTYLDQDGINATLAFILGNTGKENPKPIKVKAKKKAPQKPLTLKSFLDLVGASVGYTLQKQPLEHDAYKVNNQPDFNKALHDLVDTHGFTKTLLPSSNLDFDKDHGFTKYEIRRGLSAMWAVQNLVDEQWYFMMRPVVNPWAKKVQPTAIEKPKEELPVRQSLTVEDAKTYYKPKTLKISQEHFDILKPAIEKLVKENPDMWKKYKAKGLSNMRYNWDVFWKAKLNVRDWGLNDDHLNSALSFILHNDGKRSPKDIVMTIEKQPEITVESLEPEDSVAKISELRARAKRMINSAEHANSNSDRTEGLAQARSIRREADELERTLGIPPLN